MELCNPDEPVAFDNRERQMAEEMNVNYFMENSFRWFIVFFYSKKIKGL